MNCVTDRYLKFSSDIENGSIKILDSGVSTELERRGCRMGESYWSGRVSIDAFETLVDIHKAYIDSGADIITTNSFASSRLVLNDSQDLKNIDEINNKNIEAALTAREMLGANEVLIAGSLSHQVAWQRVGRIFKQQIDIPVSDEDLAQAFDETISYFENGEVDVILLEMMTIPRRINLLFESLSTTSLPVWCGFSAKRCKNNSSLCSWHDHSVKFKEIVEHTRDFNFDICGIMHSSVDIISECLDEIKCILERPQMAYPDSGYFKPPNWKFEGIISPKMLLNYSEGWVEQGVSVIGGCCGLGPEHTKALTKLKNRHLT